MQDQNMENKKEQCKICHEDKLFLNEQHVCVICEKGKSVIGTVVKVVRVNRGGGKELPSLSGKIDENLWMRGKG